MSTISAIWRIWLESTGHSHSASVARMERSLVRVGKRFLRLPTQNEASTLANGGQAKSIAHPTIC